MREREMIGEMMSQPSSLLPRDWEFVESVSHQLEEGKRAEPSFKQAKVIRGIYEWWQKSQGPRIMYCGTPGNGKRG